MVLNNYWNPLFGGVGATFIDGKIYFCLHDVVRILTYEVTKIGMVDLEDLAQIAEIVGADRLVAVCAMNVRQDMIEETAAYALTARVSPGEFAFTTWLEDGVAPALRLVRYRDIAEYRRLLDELASVEARLGIINGGSPATTGSTNVAANLKQNVR